MNVKYPSFHWGLRPIDGGDFDVERTADSLKVRGLHPFLVPEDRQVWDLLQAYRQAPKQWNAGRTGKLAPQIQFANADTDGKLVAFVKQFGPVVASFVREDFYSLGADLLEPHPPPVLIAEQDMNELRNERSLYSSVLTLLSELAHGMTADIIVIRDCIAEINDKVFDWPRQWKREQRLRALNYGPPISWHFGAEALRRVQVNRSEAESRRPSIGDRLAGVKPEPGKTTRGEINRAISSGHNVICELVNAFRPLVYRCGNRTIEGPDLDLRYGIRPLLYFIVRWAYINDTTVAVCANVQCRQLFEIERAGQKFCSDTCSLHQRQREYWAKRGKRLREKRRKRRKTTT